MNSPISLWSTISQILTEKIGKHSFDTWFASTHINPQNAASLEIVTPDEFFKDWIVEHYGDLIRDILRSLKTPVADVLFSVEETITDTAHEIPAVSSDPTPVSPKLFLKQLNSNFTFENFVVGKSNRFASAASKAVADAPSKAYNPLFIYGQVGLGKTHLLQAITYRIQKLHPSLKICYMTSETFTNELIDSIRGKATSDFRKKYRDIDVLLIDDIQFIAGKEATQEEFFHTFNNLHNNHKQIIITSDRPPREIANLEERLSSRFAWGLIADIQPPDFETRVAILKKKMENDLVDVPDEVVFFIAEQIKTNIRELEGALIRVVAYAKLEEVPITLSLAQKTLKGMVQETVKIITIEMIQKQTAAFFQLTTEDMRSKKRNKAIVLPRQIAMYLARQLTSLSLPEIGNAFGGKDHTTVLHSCKKIEHIIAENLSIKADIEKICTILKQ